MAKAKCKVVFQTSRFGVDAVLMSKGYALNARGLGKKPTAAQKRNARRQLMRGCRELARGHIPYE